MWVSGCTVRTSRLSWAFGLGGWAALCFPRTLSCVPETDARRKKLRNRARPRPRHEQYSS